MADQLTATQQVTASIAPVDAKGNPAQVQSVVWATSDETVATVVPGEDGLSATVIAGAPGVARIVVNADADLGEGVKPLIGQVQVTVVPGEATMVAITLGEASEQGTAENKPVPPGGKPPTGGTLPSEPNKGPGIGRPDAGLPPAPEPKK